MTELVSDLLRAAAQRHPERPAVVDGERSLSYAELDGRAGALAGRLLDLGVARGDRVGIHADKSLEAVAGLHGVLRAGAAYVPLDPQAPAARLASIARDAGLRVVLTAGARTRAWEDAVGVGDAVALDGPDLAAAATSTSPDVGIRPDDLAYVLYTSGSTGEPKGVMLSHRNALAFVSWAVAEFGVTAEDRLSSHAPLHFDLSTFDLFAAAAAGAAVVLLDPGAAVFPVEVARWIERHEITVWYSVPSALTMLVLRGGLAESAFPRLRCVLFAGEVFPVKHLERLRALLPHARLANLYGPTETNVCTWYEVPREGPLGPEAIPIGAPIAGVEVVAVGDDGEPVAPGETGELWVHGPTVMRGYWGDAEKTARALAPLPAAGFGAEPLYRTGDLARRGPDGMWRFLGRRDSQVKRRGYRLELGEIERALEAHPAVVEVAVKATPDELNGATITAYVVARGEVAEPDLVAACLERLPRYALPDAFAFLPALPKTSTGKVDRRALEPVS